MAVIALVHKWDGPLQRAGLVTVGDGVHLPAGWQPDPRHYNPAALPTPFARAEATRLLLGQLEDVVVEGQPSNVLLTQFRLLLQGLAAGVLHLEPCDLASPDFDNFGRALLQVDPEARYFCRLVDSQGLGFGSTYRTTLVWGHARRTEQQWDNLAHQVQGLQKQALGLLAEWRSLLLSAGRWKPGECPWQSGVDWVIGNATGTPDLRTLHEDAALGGPVLLELPGSDAARPSTLEPVYLPSLAVGRREQFRRLVLFAPRRGSEGVEFLDTQGNILGKILEPKASADADARALGAGSLELLSDVKPADHQAPKLQELELLLGPLRQVFHSKGRTVDGTSVSREPYFYPDALRMLEELKKASAPKNLRLTTSCSARLWLGAHLPPVGPGSVRMAWPAAGEGVELVLTDTLLTGTGVTEVLDLRAFGAALFKVFLGEASLRGARILCQEHDLFAVGVHPLEPALWLYREVTGAPPEALSQRLGILQRFVATYSVDGASEPMEEALQKAASSFANWAYGTPVMSLGRRGERSLVVDLGGRMLRLGRDGYL